MDERFLIIEDIVARIFMLMDDEQEGVLFIVMACLFPMVILLLA